MSTILFADGPSGHIAKRAVTGAFSYAAGRAIGTIKADNDNWDTAKGKLAGSGMSDAWNDPLAQAVQSEAFIDGALDLKLQFAKCMESGLCEYAGSFIFPAARVGKGLQIVSRYTAVKWISASNRSITNIRAGLTRAEFEANLSASGYIGVTSKTNSNITVYTNSAGKQYVTRPSTDEHKPPVC